MIDVAVPVQLKGLQLDNYMKCARFKSGVKFCQGFIKDDNLDIGIYLLNDGFNTDPALLGRVRFSNLLDFFNSISCGVTGIYLQNITQIFNVLSYYQEKLSKRKSFTWVGISNGFTGITRMGVIGLQYSKYCRKIINYVKELVHGNKKINIVVNGYRGECNIQQVFGEWNMDYLTGFSRDANTFTFSRHTGTKDTPETYIKKNKIVFYLDAGYYFSLLMFIDSLLGGISGVSYDYGSFRKSNIDTRVQVFSGTYTYAIELTSTQKNSQYKWFAYGVTDGNDNYWITTNIPQNFLMNTYKSGLSGEYFLLPVKNSNDNPIVVSKHLEFSELPVDDWSKFINYPLTSDTFQPIFIVSNMAQKSLFLNKLLFNNVRMHFISMDEFFNNVLKRIVKNVF